MSVTTGRKLMTESAMNMYKTMFYKNVKIIETYNPEYNNFLDYEPRINRNNNDIILVISQILRPVFANIHKKYKNNNKNESLVHYLYDIVHADTFSLSKKPGPFHPIHFKINEDVHQMWIYDYDKDSDYPLPRNKDDIIKFMRFVSFVIDSIYKDSPTKNQSSMLISKGERDYLIKNKFFTMAYFIWYFNRPDYFIHDMKNIIQPSYRPWSQTFINYIEL